MTTDNVGAQDFLPKQESARIAVERARQIVKDNNEMISKLKSESEIQEKHDEFDPFLESENFSHNDSYAFELYKIKSTHGIKDFIKDMFGVH